MDYKRALADIILTDMPMEDRYHAVRHIVEQQEDADAALAASTYLVNIVRELHTVFSAVVQVPNVPQRGTVLTQEDGGHALILEVGTGDDIGMFVRVHSWDDRSLPPTRHEQFSRLLGRKVRVTVEILD